MLWMQKLKTPVCVLLLFAICLSLAGCAAKPAAAADLMEGVSAQKIRVTESPADDGKLLSDFAVRLFRSSFRDGENVLISPLSVLCALAMTMNGAAGETRAQMEQTLGADADTLNRCVYRYMNSLPSESNSRLTLANSIWFDDGDFSVKNSFLQCNADWFGADVFRASFADKRSLDAINRWVSDQTNGMIPKILEEIPTNVVMYLINALAFDAKWEESYWKENVVSGDFTLADGTKKTADYLCSTESVYLKGENCTGFVKYYTDRRYAFAALLPDEGVSLADLVASLDGAELQRLLMVMQRAAAVYTPVSARLPKFDVSDSQELSGVLSSMGIKDAFSADRADFSEICADGDLWISRVLHKTRITVDELGTKAGAATAVELRVKGCEPAEGLQVHLDRPFVYMIIGCETTAPFFIGALTDVGE